MILSPLAHKLFKFFAYGVPAFALAVPVNYALVKWLGLRESGAYAIVLVFQVTVNFILCRRFVFDPHKDKPVRRQFLEFMASILAFRVGDWILYWYLVEKVGWYFLAVQVGNVFVFGLLKFLVSKKIMEGR
ncbi:MAG: GtrA family protein [Verrucomicrobiota bacterium]